MSQYGLNSIDYVVEELQKMGYCIDYLREWGVCLKGKFNGWEECKISVSHNRINNGVMIIVTLPKHGNWDSLKKDYLKLKEILTALLNKPSSDEYFSLPYEEGDGQELLALHAEKCEYLSYYPVFSAQEGVILDIKYNYNSMEEESMGIYYGAVNVSMASSDISQLLSLFQIINEYASIQFTQLESQVIDTDILFEDTYDYIEHFLPDLLDSRGHELNEFKVVSRQDNFVRLSGKFSSIANCDIFISQDQLTKSLLSIVVVLPKHNGWSILQDEYFKYKQVFAETYGKPESEEERFYRSYRLGDGNEMMALKEGSCIYSTIFSNKKGCIEVRIGNRGDIRFIYSGEAMDVGASFSVDSIGLTLLYELKHRN